MSRFSIIVNIMVKLRIPLFVLNRNYIFGFQYYTLTVDKLWLPRYTSIRNVIDAFNILFCSSLKSAPIQTREIFSTILRIQQLLHSRSSQTNGKIKHKRSVLSIGWAVFVKRRNINIANRSYSSFDRFQSRFDIVVRSFPKYTVSWPHRIASAIRTILLY